MTQKDRTVQSAVLEYVSHRRKAGELVGESARGIEGTLLRFSAIVGPELALRQLRGRHIEKWLEAKGSLAPSTVRTQLSAIRQFCRYARGHRWLSADPLLGVKGPRQPRSVPRGLKAEQVERAFQSLPDERAVAIVSLMVQEGLRCVEVSRLELGDADLMDDVIRVRGKGGHERVLPLSRESKSAVAAYLAAHPATSGPLVRNYRHTTSALSPHYISELVRGWLRTAGVKSTRYDRISAHAFRHTMATDMLRNGAELRDVQAALGHASIATTQIYLPNVVKGLREAMGGRSYRRANPSVNAASQAGAS